jgi:hypothetical protein
VAAPDAVARGRAVMMERNRTQLFRKVQLFLDEAR